MQDAIGWQTELWTYWHPAIPRISQCDSVQRARDILQRLREMAREDLEKEKG